MNPIQLLQEERLQSEKELEALPTTRGKLQKDNQEKHRIIEGLECGVVNIEGVKPNLRTLSIKERRR